MSLKDLSTWAFFLAMPSASACTFCVLSGPFESWLDYVIPTCTLWVCLDPLGSAWTLCPGTNFLGAMGADASRKMDTVIQWVHHIQKELAFKAKNAQMHFKPWLCHRLLESVHTALPQMDLRRHFHGKDHSLMHWCGRGRSKEKDRRGSMALAFIETNVQSSFAKAASLSHLKRTQSLI